MSSSEDEAPRRQPRFGTTKVSEQNGGPRRSTVPTAKRKARPLAQGDELISPDASEASDSESSQPAWLQPKRGSTLTDARSSAYDGPEPSISPSPPLAGLDETSDIEMQEQPAKDASGAAAAAAALRAAKKAERAAEREAARKAWEAQQAAKLEAERARQAAIADALAASEARVQLALDEARVAPWPMTLTSGAGETEATGGLSAHVGAAVQALSTTLARLDAEDVEAAIVALDDLHAYARSLTDWQGASCDWLRSTADIDRLRFYFPSLLRALHRERQPRMQQLDAAGRRAQAQQQQQALLPSLPQHSTGSARSEGYYFVKASDKKDRLASGRHQQPLEKRSKALVREPSRSTRREARNLATALAMEDLDAVAADLVKFNQLKVRRRHLRFGRSVIHEWGLFAMEDIPPNVMVIEYVGEIIRQSVADDRERRYTDLGIGSSYLFRIDEHNIVDATRCGAIARFMNHSCDPNCYAQIVTVENEPRIVIYSKRQILSGEEITYDYKFPIEDEKIPCFCGADNCRGTLN